MILLPVQESIDGSAASRILYAVVVAYSYLHNIKS